MDSEELINMMSPVSGCEPEMWGASIIGFGRYLYKYKSGKASEWFLCGFSPRKQNMTIYVMGSSKEIERMIEGVGKHKRSKGCLYFKRLADIDKNALNEVNKASVARIKSDKIIL